MREAVAGKFRALIAPGYLFVAACSITFAGLVQGLWALNHDVSELWWRWLLFAFLCFPVLAFLDHVLSRLGLEKIIPRRIALALLAVLPAAGFETELGQVLIAITTFYYIAALISWRWLDASYLRQLILAVGFTCIAALGLVKVFPSPEAATLKLYDASAWNEYTSFAVNESGVDYQSPLPLSARIGDYPHQTELTFFTYPEAVNTAVRLGGKAESPTVAALDVRTRLLFWFPVVTTFDGDMLDEVLLPPNPANTRAETLAKGVRLTPTNPPHPAWLAVSNSLLSEKIKSSGLFVVNPDWVMLIAALAFFPVLLINLNRQIPVLVEKVQSTKVTETTQRWLDGLNSDQNRRTNDRVLWFLFAVAVLLIALRAPELLWTPRLWAEDGQHFFVFAHHHKWFETLIYHPEYQLLISNLAALVSTWLPLTFAPLAFTFVSLGTVIATVAIVIWGNASLWNTVAKKFLAIAILIFVPISGEIWLNANGTQYYSALIVILILCEPTLNVTPIRKNVYRSLLVINGMNGPLASMLAPMYWIRAWRQHDREALVQAMILSAMAIIQVAAIATAGHAPDDRTDLPGPEILGWIFAVKGLLLPLGMGLADFFYSYFHYLGSRTGNQQLIMGYMLLWGVILALGAIMYRARNSHIFNFIAAFCLLVLAASLFGRGGPGNLVLLHPYLGNRYFFVPSAIVGLSVLALISLTGKRKSTTSSFVALIVAAVIVTNGVNRFYEAKVVDSDWPEWKTEITKWQTDPDYWPKIWPSPWAIAL